MTTVTSHDGLQLALRVEPGPDSFVVLFAHATGFCKEVWEPVLGALRRRGRGGPFVLADQRAHGDSDAPVPPFDWWDLGRDVLTVAAAGPEGPRFGCGHSAGATSLVLAELLAPGTFAGLVLIEPIIFPPPYVRLEDHPLSRGALRRRYLFPDTAAARTSYRGRGPFAGWADEALEAYVAGGLRPTADGVVLKCHPRDEAEFYRTGNAHGAWERLGELSCPLTIVAGEHSDTHPPAILELLAGRLPEEATFHVVPGASHFVPLERPDVVAGVVAAATPE